MSPTWAVTPLTPARMRGSGLAKPVGVRREQRLEVPRDAERLEDRLLEAGVTVGGRHQPVAGAGEPLERGAGAVEQPDHALLLAVVPHQARDVGELRHAEAARHLAEDGVPVVGRDQLAAAHALGDGGRHGGVDAAVGLAGLDVPQRRPAPDQRPHVRPDPELERVLDQHAVEVEADAGPHPFTAPTVTPRRK
jgi:hypothetical protein